MTYPLEERAALVDDAQIDAYLEMLFGFVDWEPYHIIALRPIGEKGTDQEGHTGEMIWVQPGLQDLAAVVKRHARIWAQWEFASFIIPAVLSEARGSSDAIEQMTTLIVDLDTGDTAAKLKYLTQIAGQPAMVVASGGLTDEGKQKAHVYHQLTEPSFEIEKIVEARELLAIKCGGDAHAFGRGRAHQPVRIPGTVHAKHGTQTVATIVYGGPK